MRILPITNADIRPAEDYTLEQTDSDFASVCFRLSDLPLPYNGSLDLLRGAVNRLYIFSAEFREKLLVHSFHLRARSNVPCQSGLGGSSLFVLLTLTSLIFVSLLNLHGKNCTIFVEGEWLTSGGSMAVISSAIILPVALF